MVAIIDIGATMTTLSVLPMTARSIRVNSSSWGKQLTEENSATLQPVFRRSRFGKETGRFADDYEEEVLQPFKEAVLQQVTRSLQFFFSSSQYDDVDYIVLAGGTRIYVKALRI